MLRGKTALEKKAKREISFAKVGAVFQTSIARAAFNRRQPEAFRAIFSYKAAWRPDGTPLKRAEDETGDCPTLLRQLRGGEISGQREAVAGPSMMRQLLDKKNI